MSARVVSLLLGAIALLCVACERPAGERELWSEEELAALPSGCATALARGAAPVAVGRVEGASDTYRVETSSGTCVDHGAPLSAALERYNYVELSTELKRAIAEVEIVEFDRAPVSADPSPHPDRPADYVSADPSPHPDVNTDAGSAADPSPHPDKNTEAKSDDDVVVIWIVIIVEPSPPAGSPMPTPAPPEPRSDPDHPSP